MTLAAHLDPGLQLHLVLHLLLLHQLLVLVLLAGAQFVPPLADLHHTLLQAEVVQLAVGQELLGEHLIAAPAGRNHSHMSCIEQIKSASRGWCDAELTLEASSVLRRTWASSDSDSDLRLESSSPTALSAQHVTSSE